MGKLEFLMAEYNPEKSRGSEERMEEWREKVLTGDLEADAIPGVGEKTCELLVGQGTNDTTFKVLGAFLGCMGSAGNMAGCNDFKGVLEEWGTPAAYRDTVITALGEKVNAGFSFHMVMSDTRRQSSRMTAEKLEDFLDKQLTGDLANDISGISEASAKKLADDLGTETTWQFFGIALTSSSADDFEETIKEAGVAPAWSATVVHQVVEKLAVGLKMDFC